MGHSTRQQLEKRRLIIFCITHYVGQLTGEMLKCSRRAVLPVLFSVSLLMNEAFLLARGHRPLPGALPRVSRWDLSCFWPPTRILRLVPYNYLFIAAGVAVLCTAERGCWTLSAGEQGCEMILCHRSLGCWGFVPFFCLSFLAFVVPTTELKERVRLFPRTENSTA